MLDTVTKQKMSSFPWSSDAVIVAITEHATFVLDPKTNGVYKLGTDGKVTNPSQFEADSVVGRFMMARKGRVFV